MKVFGEVTDPVTSPNKQPGRSHTDICVKFPNTYSQACTKSRGLQLLRDFGKTLWVRPMLVPCPGLPAMGPFAPKSFSAFLCSTLMQRDQPLQAVSHAPSSTGFQLDLANRSTKNDWKAGGREKPEKFFHSLSVLRSISSRSYAFVLIAAHTGQTAMGDPNPWAPIPSPSPFVSPHKDREASGCF